MISTTWRKPSQHLSRSSQCHSCTAFLKVSPWVLSPRWSSTLLQVKLRKRKSAYWCMYWLYCLFWNISLSDINIIIKSQADKSIHFHHMALQSILLYILYDYILNYTEIKRSLLQRLLFISIIVFLFLHLWCIIMKVFLHFQINKALALLKYIWNIL